MDLPRSAAVVPRLLILDSAGSTNDELALAARQAPADWPELSALVTLDQTGGRGRLGRVWTAPAGKCLAVSVLLRPDADASDRLGWLPLLAGLAMARAVREAGAPASVKWPNDVLVGGQKISGILTELTDLGVIVGAGLNLTLQIQELPTENATSLAVAGAETDADAVLRDFLIGFGELYRQWQRATDADRLDELRREVATACDTLGREVAVQLPGSATLTGTAVDLDETGRLVVAGENGVTQAVAAGDVTHLRY